MNRILDQQGGAGKFFSELHNRTDPNGFWGSTEMFILILVVLILAAALFFWAACIRKPRKKSSSRSISPAKPVKILKNPRNGEKKGRERRWKRRNPTLSETGGLPPRKPEEVVSNSR